MINTNITRHRSPTQRPLNQPIQRGLNFMGSNTHSGRIVKNDMHSSTQESTKEEQSSRQQQTTDRPIDYANTSNLAFFKVKREQIPFIKSEPNVFGIKTHHSEKVFHLKFDSRVEPKIKRSPQKYQDYFGFKNAPQKISKKQQISDSGDSEISRNSAHSSNADIKPLRFQAKKLEKKFSQEQLLKPEKFRNKDEIDRHVPLFLEERADLQRRMLLKNQLIKQNLRKQSPVQFEDQSHVTPSKRQKQDTNDVVIYKRSSLSPQNKLQIVRQVAYDKPSISKISLTPQKKSPFKEQSKDLTTSSLFKQNPTKSRDIINFIGSKSKNDHNSDFSFSKEQSRTQQSTSQLVKSRPQKSLLSLPILTMFAISTEGNTHPISFILLEKLAENRSSSILKVLHPQSNIVFCLKRCAVERTSCDQLIVEHKVSLFLNHSNLVRAYASFYDRSYLYLLMEYMEGRSLTKTNDFKTSEQSPQKSNDPSWQSQINFRNKISRLSFRQKPKILTFENQRYSDIISPFRQLRRERLMFIKGVLEQILEGLVFLHENGIIHRDLKPDNIFVSHRSFKIGDFGSCTYSNSQEYVGTLDYAAPQIMLQQRYDRSIDMWSLGCIAYELDVGSPPFYHYDRAETIRKITCVEYDDEAITDDSLRVFISKLLLRQGNSRMSANGALMEIKMMEFGDTVSKFIGRC